MQDVQEVNTEWAEEMYLAHEQLDEAVAELNAAANTLSRAEYL